MALVEADAVALELLKVADAPLKKNLMKASKTAEFV
jgi:hypothetical protein